MHHLNRLYILSVSIILLHVVHHIFLSIIDTVLASTKVHSSSQIHMSIHGLFNGSKNEASTLHFRRPSCGYFHLTEVILLVVAEEFRVVPEPLCLSDIVVVI